MEPDTALYTCRASNEQDFVDAHALLKVHGNVECYTLVVAVLINISLYHSCDMTMIR